MEKSKLYNPQYKSLTPKEREALLLSISENDKRFVFSRFERFEKFGMATETAVYTWGGREFVFVPGGEVTLGWDSFDTGMDDPTLNDINGFFEEFDSPPELNAFLREQMSPVRKAIVPPMLAERTLNYIGWRDVALGSPELEPYKKDIERHFNGTSMLTVSGKMRIFKDEGTGSIRPQIYEPVSLNDFLEQVHSENFDLPTEDEWEYLCGCGSRTLFRWGDSFDYEMKLYHFETDSQKDTPYTLEEPNQFGLPIAYDPYKYEVVEASKYFVKGGDGGCGVCGGFGITLGYLPVATYFRSASLSNDELRYQDDIGGDYTFFRRIVRL